MKGDSIYNGAVDNGTSLAWMLEIAEAFTKLKEKPRRTIMFFAPTAEEQGLLGSAFYVKNPVYPINKTVANINNDLMLPFGRMKDVMVTGYGQSELDEYVRDAALIQDRYIFPDPNPETGMYFRSDHFSFAKAGIPSLFVRGNCEHEIHGREWMAKKEKDWLSNFYHKPTDEYDPETWDFTGIADDTKLLFMVGYKLGNEDIFPEWKPDSEFRSIRKESME
jgi:Zn-dependent M28 family amino/carboxypeptidase